MRSLPWSLPTAACVLLAGGGAARAAGGHFDVDDANILAPGHCQAEFWANRAPRDATRAWHVGPSCRVGPFELGVDVDRVTVEGDRSTVLGPHLKWSTALLPDRFSVGAVVGTAFDLRRGSDPVTAYFVPLTWVVAPAWSVNAMIGQDRGNGGTTAHVGASLEWSPSERWTLIGEHARIGGGRIDRVGGRWSFDGGGSSIDLSVARRRVDAGPLWTIGFNHDFEH